MYEYKLDQLYASRKKCVCSNIENKTFTDFYPFHEKTLSLYKDSLHNYTVYQGIQTVLKNTVNPFYSGYLDKQ